MSVHVDAVVPGPQTATARESGSSASKNEVRDRVLRHVQERQPHRSERATRPGRCRRSGCTSERRARRWRRRLERAPAAPAARLHRPIREEALEGSLGAAAEVAPERGVAGRRRHDEARLGRARATRRAFSTGVRRSSSPSSSSTGTSGSGPGPNSGASGAFGQRSQRSSVSLASGGGAVERRERGVGIVSRPRRGLAVTLGGVGRRGARPRQRHLLAGRRGVHGRAERGGRRRLGVDAKRAPAQAQQRRDVAGQRRAHRAGEGRRSPGSKSPARRMREQVHARQTPASPRPRSGRPARPRNGPRLASRSTRRARSRDRVAWSTGSAARQSERSARGTASNVSQVEGVGAVHLDDRVEHEPVDPCRVAHRVARARPSFRMRCR